MGIFKTIYGNLLDWAGLTNIPAALKTLTGLKGKPGQLVSITASDDGVATDFKAVSLSAGDVGAEAKGAVSSHNTSTDAHGDIRLELQQINARLTAFFDSDDQTLDELSEIVAYITGNKTLIDAITTSKVNVTDIINNLTTNVSNRPLSAAQGVVIKTLLDGLRADLPTALPNPYPLTINGKSYDGSEEVNVVVTGGATSDATSLGQTPVTLPQTASIRLVGEGEHTYTIKGVTVADLSTATIAKTNVVMTEHEDHIELTISGNPANWYNAFAAFTFDGFTIGENYALCVESLGIDNVNLSYSGYFLVKNARGTELARLEDSPAGLVSKTFTADTETITVTWYPSNGYYWTNGYRTALVGDIYINKASDGTERTGVINESGTFTDSCSLGQLQKGITITSEPSCEVYTVSGGGVPGEVSAPLAGKTVVCFGDSLFGMYTGDTSAPAYVAERTGATVYNVGFGGCRMSEHPYTGYNEFCMYALADAVASGDWSAQDAAASKGSANFPDQLAILKSIDFDTVDYIVIHYGTNDFAAGAGVAIDNPGNPKATNTLCGALRYSVETLLAAFPKLNIFVSLPAFRYWTDNGTVTYSDEKKNVNGHTLPEFVKALADTAKEYKLPVIDCYYGLGINKSNAATFLADGTHHNIEGRKRFGEYIGAKLISNGDTFLGTDSATGGSGSSIDVTAEVGQTIVVKEVDANGKPTKWEAVDYQERTHWQGEKVMVPEQNFEAGFIGNNIVAHSGMPLMGLTVGKTYRVVFDGVTYTCVAEAGVVSLDGVNMFNVISIGSLGMFGGTDNGRPFILVDALDYDPPGWACVPYEYGAHTLSVTGVDETVTIPDKYVNHAPAFPYYIDVTYTPGETANQQGTYYCGDTVKNVEANYDAGRSIVVRLREVDAIAQMLPLSMSADARGGIDIDGDGDIDTTSFSQYGVTFLFMGLTYASVSNARGRSLYLSPLEDGTYYVSETLGD